LFLVEGEALLAVLVLDVFARVLSALKQMALADSLVSTLSNDSFLSEGNEFSTNDQNVSQMVSLGSE